MSNGDFNPMSADAQFATIVSELKRQDRDRWEYQKTEMAYRDGVTMRLDRIQASVDKTNGRVTSLEQESWKNRGFVAAIGLGAAALWQWISHK